MCCLYKDGWITVYLNWHVDDTKCDEKVVTDIFNWME